MDNVQVIELLIIGLVAGFLGGMSGLGGSVVMIPMLAIVLGPNQHLYQAAAMIVNVLVAVTATMRHAKAKAIRWDVATRMLPVGLTCIALGVLVSNVFEATEMQKVFGVFLLYIVATDILKFIQREPEPEPHELRVGWGASGFVGGIMGFTAGLLGIGGGGLAVPMLQRVCNLPLRQAIATSSAVMCLTSVMGAVIKNATLHRHLNIAGTQPLPVMDSIVIAAVLAPGAVLGGFLGAAMTHKLPLVWIRVAFDVLLLAASAKLIGLV